MAGGKGVGEPPRTTPQKNVPRKCGTLFVRASVACDDFDGLARLLLFPLAEFYEGDEAFLNCFDGLLVGLVINLVLPLLGESEGLGKTLTKDGCRDSGSSVAALEGLVTQEARGVRLAVICFAQIPDAALLRVKPDFCLGVPLVIVLSFPANIDVDSHNCPLRAERLLIARARLTRSRFPSSPLAGSGLGFRACREAVPVTLKHLLLDPCNQCFSLIRGDVVSKLGFELLKMSHS